MGSIEPIPMMRLKLPKIVLTGHFALFSSTFLELKNDTYKINLPKIQAPPLVIVDSSVIHKMSTVTIESTISREIKASTDNQSTEHIHYNKTRYTITRDDCSLNRILCSFHISPLFIALKDF